MSPEAPSGGGRAKSAACEGRSTLDAARGVGSCQGWRVMGVSCLRRPIAGPVDRSFDWSIDRNTGAGTLPCMQDSLARSVGWMGGGGGGGELNLGEVNRGNEWVGRAVMNNTTLLLAKCANLSIIKRRQLLSCLICPSFLFLFWWVLCVFLVLCFVWVILGGGGGGGLAMSPSMKARDSIPLFPMLSLSRPFLFFFFSFLFLL